MRTAAVIENTDAPSQIENSFIDLENANDNIRRQALDDIENLSTGVPKEQFISIYRRLLSCFKIYPPNSSFTIRFGRRIWENLQERRTYFNCEELLKMFLDVIASKIKGADNSSLNEYLVMAEDAISNAGHLLKDSRFMELFLQYLQLKYLSLPHYIKPMLTRIISIIESSSLQYGGAIRDSLPVALQLTHLGSWELREAIFRLLRRVYEAISASTDKPFLDCNFETVGVLLEALSDNCARIYHQRQDEDVPTSVLIALPLGWLIHSMEEDEGEFETHEALINGVVIILNYLHLISQSNVGIIKWLLHPKFNFTASVVALLLYSREEIVEGCVLALLDSIISQIEKSRYAEDREVKVQVEREAERLRVNMAFIEALHSRNRAEAGQIMSKSAEDLFNDHRNRDPLIWADYLGASEWKEYLLKCSNGVGDNNSRNIRLHLEMERWTLMRSLNVESSQSRQRLHLFYFLAELLPVLLMKFQKYPSEIHRYAIILLIHKIINNMSGPILEWTLLLTAGGNICLHTLCYVIRDAYRSPDHKTVVAAYEVWKSLVRAVPSGPARLVDEYKRRHILPRFNQPSTLGIYLMLWQNENCCELAEISRGVYSAAEYRSKEVVIFQLERHFQALKSIFGGADMVLTASKLRTSGIIDALLDCLAASSCYKWHRSIKVGTMENHHDFLIQRRNAFMLQFHKSQELNRLFRLLVEEVEEVGTFSIYLPELRLHMKNMWASCTEDPTSVRGRQMANWHFVLKGRTLEVTQSDKAIQILEQWFDIMPESELDNLENTEGHLLGVWAKLQLHEPFGSNDGENWSTLSVHKNESRICGESVLFPLQSDSALSSDGRSYRMFRIVDLSPIDKQKRMQVCGLDFFGKIVGIHQKLLDDDSLETNFSTKYLISQMKAVKRGAKFAPVEYARGMRSEYNLHGGDNEPMNGAFSVLFDFANCINMKTKKRLPPPRFQLVATNQWMNAIESIEIDNYNTPILKYAMRLAEMLARKGYYAETSLSLKCFLSENSEGLAATSTATTPTDSDRSLQLAYLLHELSSTYVTGKSRGGESGSAEDRAKAGLKYYSQRLCRLIERQLNESTVIGLGIIPHWCDSLEREHCHWTGHHSTLNGWVESVTETAQRNAVDGDGGRQFWSSAERLMNENAESKLEFTFSYDGEPGIGDGVDRDFYSELSREFCRKSGHMWLDASKSEDSLFVHTQFGLFPTPYPRHLVPVGVLRRFHILGISIAKALQLSGSRHWLTGLLDEEDFLLLYPHYRSILPGLLELYRRQRTQLEDGDGLKVELLRPFIDSASKEIFGVELDDLCIPMTVECNSHTKTTTVKLRDVYPWESGSATTTRGDDEVNEEEEEEYCISPQMVINVHLHRSSEVDRRPACGEAVITGRA
ncbi:unnamed protein product [Rodentolepis nana]|uniref:E3 ubiquitin-protein ligase n=1 Tax=Rodentolepis nana TaxID=102285 RepID=A0A0R3TXZ5_RODNA|nr:unnamed protein product [Rodentolepis nana]